LNDVKLSSVSLDRTQVVKAAIELLDEVGLDGLTLRRLAQELGVQAPALYWHFKNKQELLDQMVYVISTTEAPLRQPVDGEAWDHWLAERARDIRRSINRHRDGAMLVASTHPHSGQWQDIEDSLGVLADAGMTPADGLRAMLTVGNYVSGFTLEEQADRTRGSTGNDVDAAELEEMMTALADYPLLSEALREVGDPQGDSAFEAGLDVVLDGLRQRASRAGGATS
jgi:TetR/AcrR family transcriptional regulator, tetracycline repressor protein